MERARGPYDLIVYALPDSLAAYSSLSNIRLESFLFTVESFEQAKRLLRDDGVLVLYNYYRTAWLVDKLTGMLTQAFGHRPIVTRYTSQAGGMLAALAIGPQVSEEAAGPPAAAAAPSYPSPSTDNWPFLYMEEPHVPPMYWLVMVVFVACGLLAVAATGQLRAESLRVHAPFLFMGAAFFLLETRSLIQFALLFGATWLVNALVFVAILVSVLLANLLVMRWRAAGVGLPFLLLAVALAAQLLVPIPKLVAIQNPVLRYVLASLLLFAPIFCANLAFGRLFRDTEKSTAAFGCNIIGTMLGAALEYTSLAIGYHAQGWIVLCLYVLAGLWAARTMRGKVSLAG
jgi:MFS family permease